jgi:hypothetical protein
VIVGVVNDRSLAGIAPGRGPRWRFVHALEGRPHIAGEVVVGMGNGMLFALDAITGALLWERHAHGSIRGVADDGGITVVSIASVSGMRSTVLAVARDGSVVRQLYEVAEVGRPAVIDALAFLPWDRHRVVIFDLLDGFEVARVVTKREVVQALVADGDVFFGAGNDVLRFDEAVVAARDAGGTWTSLPTRDFPGEPRWLASEPSATPLAATRDDRIRYHASISVERGQPKVRRYALGYQRLVVGLEAPKGSTTWTHLGTDTFLAGSATRHSVVVCDAAGRARWLDLASGVTLTVSGVGTRVVACVVQNGFGANAGEPPRPAQLAAQLGAAIADRDPSLLPMQLELLDDLAAIAGDSPAAQLIELGRTSPERATGRQVISSKARELLAERRSGGKALVDALEAERRALRPGWLPVPERPTLPLAAVAVAASAMGEVAAAPALARFLNHPRLEGDEVAALARALYALADREQVEELMAFALTTPCSHPDEQRRNALEWAGRALARLGRGPFVRRLATESCDDAAMRKRLLSAASS